MDHELTAKWHELDKVRVGLKDVVVLPSDLSPIQLQIGDLSALKTDAKDNLVAAINEAAESGGSSDAVLYVSQTLTDEQKKQARENVGAEEVYGGLVATNITSPINGLVQTTYTTPESCDLLPYDAADTDNKFKYFRVYGMCLGIYNPVNATSAKESVEFVKDIWNKKYFTGDHFTAYKDPLKSTVFSINHSIYGGKSLLSVHYDNGNANFSAEINTETGEFSTVSTSYSRDVRVIATNFENAETLPQQTMASAPAADMQIATKKYVDDHEPKSLGIASAKIGQIVKISAVDENGVPTAWSPVDMPTGGGGGSAGDAAPEILADVTTDEDTATVTLDGFSAYKVTLLIIMKAAESGKNITVMLNRDLWASKTWNGGAFIPTSANNANYLFAYDSICNGVIKITTKKSNWGQEFANLNQAVNTSGNTGTLWNGATIQKLTAMIDYGNVLIPAGTRFIVWKG